MTEPKKAVEGKQAENPPSGAKKQTTAPTQNKKPAAPSAQAKSSASKSPAKASASASKQGSGTFDSAKLKENAAKAEALENRNILLPEENGSSNSATEPSDVTGVIVHTDQEEVKVTENAREMKSNGKENIGQVESDKKDKAKHSKKADASEKDELHEGSKPKKDKDTLMQKTAKAEKKVNKLKNKVHKAEKKEVKKSKLRLLKEKLTKAFSKWQRRKKKLNDSDK